MHVKYDVALIARNTWSVRRLTDGRTETVFVTLDHLCAIRVRDELERADRRAFYEGLILAKAA